MSVGLVVNWCKPFLACPSFPVLLVTGIMNSITLDFNLVIVRNERGEYTAQIVPVAPLPPIEPRLEQLVSKASEIADKHLAKQD